MVAILLLSSFTTTEPSFATSPVIVKIIGGSSNPMQEENLSPKMIRVVLGVNNTVTWINEDYFPYTIRGNMVTLGVAAGFDFDSGVLRPNETFYHIFTDAGIYTIHTEPSPWIRGTVIVESPENARQSGLQMSLFSPPPFLSWTIGLSELNSVTGFLKDRFGNGIADRAVMIFANTIPMGKVTTDSEGCFYFNNWDNAKLKPLLDYGKSIGLGSISVNITAVFSGDFDFKKSIAYRKDLVYTGAGIPIGPAVRFTFLTKEGPTWNLQLTTNAGDSIALPLTIQSISKGGPEPINGSLSLDALPCTIHASVTPLLIPVIKSGGTANATIHISADPNAQEGNYTLGIVGKAIWKDSETGEFFHGKTTLGLLHLTVKPMNEMIINGTSYGYKQSSVDYHKLAGNKQDIIESFKDVQFAFSNVDYTPGGPQISLKLFFSDGSSESLQGTIWAGPPWTKKFVIILSKHTNPQAGIIFDLDKGLTLLVSNYRYPFSVERIEIASDVTSARDNRPGDHVFIMTPVENLAPEPKNFSYITRVTDKEGFTVSLQLANGTLASHEKVKVSNLWVPDRAGPYTIDTFFWSSINDSPIPLSRSMTATMPVIPYSCTIGTSHPFC